ncbi:MAG TPA: agmatine deiminase family protein [Candidatus Nanoarchaeia archaeon]|nr:agmatine deiminase family protein [Candidatus Nanoarchaeia archaeon]
MDSTPKSLGFRMPAEWEPQEAIWLSWPHNEVTWPKMVPEIEEIYVQFIKALHSGQKANLLVNDKEREDYVKNKLAKSKINLSQIIFHQIRNVDAWFRDYGPTFVVNGKTKEKAMVKWMFNAWGNKYDDLKEDNIIPYEMNKKMKLKMFEPKIVLEGGSIEVNGTGTLLTSEQCLLNKNRNPNLTKTQIEQYLKDYLNVSNILWLKEGIVGDDTDGHIDDLARFVSQNTVVCAFEDNPDDENYEILKKNYELLVKMKDEKGNRLNVIKLPMPGFVGDKEGRLPASYCNFYIGNEAVVVPVFGHEDDKKALEILQKRFPERKVIGINCTSMVYGFGALHCVSQQETKA